MAQRLIDKDGRLKVPIPPQFCAPIGEHAAKMASKIGYEVRTNVIDLGVRRWKAVDDTVKAPILQRLTDKFDLQGDPMDVDKVVATQCGRRMSDFTFRLHKKYKKLLETKGPEYARSNPPRNVKLEQWTSLIDNKWNDKRWQVQSLVNTNNRASEKHLKHRCGSKSLSVRVAAAMKDGVVPPLKEIYQSTHYNKDTNEWISPGCKDKFDEMEKIEAEHNSQEGAVPMTQEDLSIKVFKKRSGYIKGLGMRPSSSVRTYVNSYEYVTNLEKKVQERDEIIQEHVEKIEAANATIVELVEAKEQANATIVELVEAKEQANATIADLVEAKEQQGRTLASVLEFIKQQGYTGVS